MATMSGFQAMAFVGATGSALAPKEPSAYNPSRYSSGSLLPPTAPKPARKPAPNAYAVADITATTAADDTSQDTAAPAEDDHTDATSQSSVDVPLVDTLVDYELEDYDFNNNIWESKLNGCAPCKARKVPCKVLFNDKYDGRCTGCCRAWNAHITPEECQPRFSAEIKQIAKTTLAANKAKSAESPLRKRKRAPPARAGGTGVASDSAKATKQRKPTASAALRKKTSMQGLTHMPHVTDAAHNDVQGTAPAPVAPPAAVIDLSLSTLAPPATTEATSISASSDLTTSTLRITKTEEYLDCARRDLQDLLHLTKAVGDVMLSTIVDILQNELKNVREDGYVKRTQIKLKVLRKEAIKLGKPVIEAHARILEGTLEEFVEQ